MLKEFSDAEWTQAVNHAFKNYQSVLTLSRSPLANSGLVLPLLVIDQVSASAERRGWALRLLLQWGVEQLPPDNTLGAPFGEERPFDDPTWQDPRWWGYNILRHRYMEPLHPDLFVEGGRFTETLMALTGIPSVDLFYEERNRAIGDVAQRLRQQFEDGAADERLRRLALDGVYRPLAAQPAALALLGIASTFREVFPKELLLEMAALERLTGVTEAFDYLTSQRLLLLGDGGSNLWLSPTLQTYVYQRQESHMQLRRNMQAAQYYEREAEPLRAAEFWYRAERYEQAAEVLLEAAEVLINEMQIVEVRDALQMFGRPQLPDALWGKVQQWLTDLLMRLGQRDEALTACRAALRVTEEPAKQAPLYRRLGKLYEEYNQLHALNYYQQAAERFAPNDPERLDLLKDRAWVYILREEWAAAEQDLQMAMAQIPAADAAASANQQADVCDALAGLYRRKKEYDTAVQYAQRALALREESGDLLRVARSFTNLGLLYNALGEYEEAIQVYEEALAISQRFGHQQFVGKILLNIGMAYHLAGQRPEAVETYLQSLKLGQTLEMPYLAAKAYSNLAEIYGELGHYEVGQQYWEEGYALSQRAGFDDQVGYFEWLREQMPGLAAGDLLLAVDSEQKDAAVVVVAPLPDVTAEALDVDEQLIIELAQREGKVTTKDVMEAAEVSKATATRRLTALAERGYLQKQGQGRGTHYVAAVAAAGLADERLDVIERVLQAQKVWLGQTYGVKGIGVHSLGIGSPYLELSVRFDTLPSVALFFELEDRLGELVQMPVDVRPERVGRPEGVGVVRWVW